MSFNFASLVLWVLVLGVHNCQSSCHADNVLRAIQAQSIIGQLDCQYLLSTPYSFSTIKVTGAPVTDTFTVATTTKTIKATGTGTITTTSTATFTEYTTTYTPYLPSYVSQYPESRVSSACSCIAPFVVTETVYPSIISTTIKDKLSTDITTKYSTYITITEAGYEFRPATTTFPALCFPTNLVNNYGSATPSRAVKTISAGKGLDDLHCCTTCFNKKDCLYWSNIHAESGSTNCKVIVGTDTVNDLELNICPLGIQQKGNLGQLGNGALNYGPCLKDGEVLLMSTPCGGTGSGCP